MAKAPKLKLNPHAVTANDLATGDVVYLTESGQWSRDLADAAIAPSQEDSGRLVALAEQAAAANQVVAPYVIPLVAGAHPPAPVQFREKIRASGPTAGNNRSIYAE